MFASAVTTLAPARVKAMMRGCDTKLVIFDVRDSDFVGGHIKGAKNIVAARFDQDEMVDQLLASFCRDAEVIIVHCYLSQQRGPYCAQRLAERLEAQGGTMPEVCVMSGGWRRFKRELQEEDFELVEDLPY